MSFVHGKNTYVSVNSTDLSAFTNTSEYSRNPDTHDVTTYGKNDHVFSGGLGNGTFSMGGIYDSGVSGPRAILKPLEGQQTRIVRRPEGTGSGKPQDQFDAIVQNYVETSPVADMIAWTCEFQMSGAVTGTAQ